MTDYKQTSITGTSWQRANQIVIENKFNQTPVVHYVEEMAVNTGSQIITQSVGNLSVPLTDMSKAIPLHDPTTGLPVTTAAGATSMTLEQLMVGIYSHYITSAKKRDAAATTTP